MLNARKIEAALKGVESAELEVHDDGGALTLMAYWDEGSKSRSLQLATEKIPGKGAKVLKQALYYEWLSQMLVIWQKNHIVCDGIFSWHDTLHGIRLADGRAERADFPALTKVYPIAAIDVIVQARARFTSQEEMDFWMDEWTSEYAARVRRYILKKKPDWTLWICALDISRGAPTEAIPILIPKELRNRM